MICQVIQVGPLFITPKSKGEKMEKVYLKSRYSFREDTLENWVENNPILEKGEPSIVQNPTNEVEWLKIGDGATAWNDLPYRKGPQGDKGDKGDPYTLTEQDKHSISNEVLNNLEVWAGGSY